MDEVNVTKKPKMSARLYIEDEQIMSLLDSASRGASYWCSDSGELGYESATKAVMTPGKMIALHDSENDGKYHELNRSKIKKGLVVMAKKELKHFMDFYTGDYDQTTGDVFLQCCLFGEVIYG